jgi:hypothetical protein
MERLNEWGRLFDCESGDWDASGDPIAGTRRWDYGISFDHGDIFEGAANFHPDTWDWVRPANYPDHAGNATPLQQVLVAEEVLRLQGPEAWPVCSQKVDFAL